jgi:hypothetical protein
MIKRFLFGTPTQPPPCPTAIRPLRASLNKPVEPLAESAGFFIQWFADSGALAGYEAWERDQCAVTSVVLVEEVIQRGSEWLEQRWCNGGRKWKHVALARRAQSISAAEFSARWRGHAGSATTRQGGTVAIPESARGLAYVQNHPVPRASGDWLYDAITEVWFDDAQSMQSRIAWFRDNIVTDDLFGEASFVALTEDCLVPSS